MRLKKDSIDWLANQRDVFNLILNLGARNLTTITSTYITADDEIEVRTYSKMVEHDDEADRKAMDWVTEQIQIHNKDERYLYFRLKK